MKAEFTAWYLAAMIDLLGKGVESQARLNLEWLRDDGSFADPSLRLALMAWEASSAGFKNGTEAAAKLIDNRIAEYVSEHGIYDQETGFTDFPGNGGEMVEEWDGLASRIRGIKP